MAPKLEDDLTKNGRQPHPKCKMTSPKIEDDITQNTKMEDKQNGRRTIWKMTKMENNQNERRQK